MAAWGGDRQRAWSDYYQFVQRYLRGVVRLDPERAVSQRLRDQLAGWLDRPFSLIVAGEPSIRLLRDDEVRVDRPPVVRAHTDREPPLEEVPPDAAPRALADQVEEALAGGCATLGEVSARVLPALPAGTRYRAAGQVAAVVAQRARVEAPLEPPWIDLGDLGLALEDWSLRRMEEN